MFTPGDDVTHRHRLENPKYYFDFSPERDFANQCRILGSQGGVLSFVMVSGAALNIPYVKIRFRRK
jgi:hypothetical protein